MSTAHELYVENELVPQQLWREKHLTAEEIHAAEMLERAIAHIHPRRDQDTRDLAEARLVLALAIERIENAAWTRAGAA